MDQMIRPLYPLRFKEILRDYGFGDRWIVREFQKTNLPEDHRIAETWEVCDRPGESSEIINGWMAGKTLRQAIDYYGDALLGHAVARRFGTRFPLLIKLLDATNVLGEQIHPGDEIVTSKNMDDYSGKTEAWYMLRVKPDATIHCGHKPGIKPAELKQAFLDGRSKACMVEQSAKPGDAFLLHAGTIHYASGGVLFYEIMQNSDITIGLSPRKDTGDKDLWAEELLQMVHFEDGADCRTRPVTVKTGGNTRTWLIVCEYFVVERLDLNEAYLMEMDGTRFRFITAIEGTVCVDHSGGTVTLHAGCSCLLPADSGDVHINPTGDAAVLVAYVPDLVEDVVKPLRDNGVEDDDIRAIGGCSELNPLNKLTEA